MQSRRPLDGGFCFRDRSTKDACRRATRHAEKPRSLALHAVHPFGRERPRVRRANADCSDCAADRLRKRFVLLASFPIAQDVPRASRGSVAVSCKERVADGYGGGRRAQFARARRLLGTLDDRNVRACKRDLAVSGGGETEIMSSGFCRESLDRPFVDRQLDEHADHGDTEGHVPHQLVAARAVKNNAAEPRAEERADLV